MRRCVIIGASPETDTVQWASWVRKDDFIMCADGGYVLAQQAGLIPQLIIGDFDSAAVPAAPPCEVIRLPVKKDDTDTMYCIKEGMRRGFRSFLLLGMTGGRPDHTFANFAALTYLSQRKCQGIIMDTEWCYCALTDDKMILKGCQNSRFAVFPFGCAGCRVSLSGFLYEGANIDLSADYPVGVSNTILSDSAAVQVEGTALLMFTQPSNGQFKSI